MEYGVLPKSVSVLLFSFYCFFNDVRRKIPENGFFLSVGSGSSFRLTTLPRFQGLFLPLLATMGSECLDGSMRRRGLRAL